MKMKPIDRVLLLLTGLLAAWQIVVGIDGLDVYSMTAYTIGFGVLLVAGLLMIILGFEVLDSPVVVIISTIIPLSLSMGLVRQHAPSLQTFYLSFSVAGFFAIIATRLTRLPGMLPTIILVITHGIAGLTIFLLPILFALNGKEPAGFALVGIGGALIGIGGLLLSFLKVGKPIFSREKILGILPGLLLLMTACFVIGFMYV